MNNEEKWIPVVGFEGRYEVSDLGRIRSKITGDKVLKAANNGNGYLHVSLRKDGRYWQKYVHRIVMESFCPIDGAFEVNHKDFDKGNNRLDNLEWVTRSGNFFHALDAGRNQTLSAEKVSRIISMRAAGHRTRAIASEFGVTQNHIRKILRGNETWTHLGLKSDCLGPARGEHGGANKLRESQVVDIIHKCRQGQSYRSLGREYGVSTNAIRDIALRRNWKHVNA